MYPTWKIKNSGVQWQKQRSSGTPVPRRRAQPPDYSYPTPFTSFGPEIYIFSLWMACFLLKHTQDVERIQHTKQAIRLHAHSQRTCTWSSDGTQNPSEVSSSEASPIVGTSLPKSQSAPCLHSSRTPSSSLMKSDACTDFWFRSTQTQICCRVPEVFLHMWHWPYCLASTVRRNSICTVML